MQRKHIQFDYAQDLPPITEQTHKIFLRCFKEALLRTLREQGYLTQIQYQTAYEMLER